ncbi:methionyl-tRNA formyltransferase [Opitutaceae bacterium EW11]|nr:methionyl-tRNA formyltransferase [Opitutaceae bacterium EW11]
MPLRVVFLGSDIIALPLLDWLAGEGRALATLVGVFTQPDRATGRGQQIVPNGIKTWAVARGLPVFQPEKLTDESREQLAALRPDLALVMAYGHLLRDPFIETPRFGTLNFHASLLPNYRGASPIQTAVAAGDAETGVSLMRIVRKLDAGPVADVERVSIGSRDTALDVEAKLAASCVPLLRRALPKLVEGSLEFVPQDDSKATFCRKLEKEDGTLDFRVSAQALSARIRGLFPWPACAFSWSGQTIKVGLADAVETPVRSGNPGAVLGVDNEGLLVATGSGTLRLLKLQRPGGRMLPALEFLRGFPVSPGTVLPSQPMPPLVFLAPFRKNS